MTRLTVVSERDELVRALQGDFEAASASAEPRALLTHGQLPDAYLVEASATERLELVGYLAQTARPLVVLALETPPGVVAAYFEAGADAVVRRTESLEECTARLKALTRRTALASSHEACYRFGDVTLYPERRSILVGGEPLHFTRTEFNLLTALAQRLDQVTTHRHLMQEVWGQEYLSARHYLRVYIRRVREKIEADPNRPELLIAFRAKGYMLRSTPQPAPMQPHSEPEARHRVPAAGPPLTSDARRSPYAPSLAG